MISNLALRLKDVFAPKTALVEPAPQGEFVKGINFGGEAVAIEGYLWQSYDSALANGLAVPGASAIATSIQPTPYAHPNIRRMLNTVVYKTHTLEIHQALANGDYEVFLWIMENYQSDWHSLDVALAGKPVAAGIGKLPHRTWARYGPYRTTVTDELLHLTITTNSSEIDAHLMGLSIFRAAG